MTVSTEWKTVRVSDHGDMRVFIAKPQGAKTPLPAVLVLQEGFGVNAHIRDVAQRIAALGFVAVAPELFHRTAPGFEAGYDGDMQDVMKNYQAVTDAGLEADLRATHDLLANDMQVDKAHIGAVGFCMGGRAAFLANAILPLACAVSYYGGGIAELPLSRTWDQHGPILLFWGGKDAHIETKQHSATVNALRQTGKSFINVEFSNAEHGFFCDERKSYDPAAASESWALMTAFFERHLKVRNG